MSIEAKSSFSFSGLQKTSGSKNNNNNNNNRERSPGNSQTG